MDEWESWQSLGVDKHSLVADPLFVNATKDDYRLRKNSPAFKLGFKPIPADKIGPYHDELRASWPIVEAEGVREHPQPVEMGSLWPDQAPVGDGTFDTANANITVHLPAPDKANGAAAVILILASRTRGRAVTGLMTKRRLLRPGTVKPWNLPIERSCSRLQLKTSQSAGATTPRS